ncbi:MAG TPA: electron transport complex subunit RsxA [Bacteroidales bacterium]|nr:MAG: electron transport complex subunit RsxA [Bacteroidetes bacterium GWE2_42_24]OFY29505.1 MAG: electron transport complex subunit RsxA [Bacteroidetes bacterium GWF2_43_11]PKP17695.1 MAG: electron transport complex subunit RsxA [Bacteroidetes bacterium HGW-Bacteroidetes-22]HAQ64705.1 electron transport complex subunit RsxA [Bacteroidales bacterium]HBZ67301.1 electron transport complex subunit RsxA [Bacteroidales bacterium]
MEFISIIIIALLVNNVVLAQFLGICPFLGVSNKVETAAGMGAAVVFVMSLANLVTFLVNAYILIPLDIEFMQTISFIFVIASLVQVVEIILKKTAPSLYQALGIYLPLITTNCAVLGIALLAVQKDYNLIMSVVYAAATAVGFTLAMVLMAGIREHMEMVGYPKGMKGFPMSLLIAGLLSLAFMGFSGMVK